MNANPAHCACERCEIDRARALPMGMAHGFPRSDHSAGQRDSPEALGSLLALTGLMLEKESELSSAVVGRAAGQQDQGEQSPLTSIGDGAAHRAHGTFE